MKKKIINIFLIVIGLLYTYIIVNMFGNFPLKGVSNLALIIGIIVYLLFMFLVFKVSKIVDYQNKRITIISFIIFVIIQILFAYFLAVNPSWDFGTVYNAVVDDINGGFDIFEVTYFYQFGLNLGIALLLKLVFSFFALLGINNYLILGIGLNIIFIDIALIYLYKLIKLVIPNKNIYFFLIVTLTFTPFITYVPIFYSDTLSLPFGIASIYYLYKYYYCNNLKENLVISGLLIGVGACLKFTLIIIYLAVLVFYFIKERKSRFTLKPLLFLGLFVFLPIFIINSFVALNQDNERLEREKMPFTHSIMMGLRKNGGFSIEDSKYTVSFPTKYQKVKANIKTIKKRLKYYKDNHELLKFYTNKLEYTWGDGTFFASEKLSRDSIKNTKISDYIYGSKKYYYFSYAKAQWLIVLCFLVMGLIFRKYLSKNQQDLQLFIYIALAGLMLFLLIWECRSRYLVNYLPIILLASYLGFVSFIEYVKLKLKGIVQY